MGGDKPDILSVFRTDVNHRPAVGNHDRAPRLIGRAPRWWQAGHGSLALLGALSQVAEMLKVAIWHTCHVLAVEDTNLEALHLTVLARRIHASGLETLQW